MEVLVCTRRQTADYECEPTFDENLVDEVEYVLINGVWCCRMKIIHTKVNDNGIGFDVHKKETSKAFHALEALKERVSLLQGKNKKELEISSSPSGTTIILLIAYNTVA